MNKTTSHKITTYRNFILPFLGALLIISATIWAYQPGIHGGFVFDDYANIAENNLLHIDTLKFPELWQAAWSRPGSNSTKRWLSMLSFGLNYYFTGLDTYPMKWTNLIIHIFTGLSLFVVSYLLLNLLNQKNKKFVYVALLASGIWMLHPFQLTSVTYIVQRMTSLSALFTVLSIIAYLLGRLNLINGRLRGWLWILLCAPTLGFLGVLSKENAALLPIYLFCIEYCLLKFKTSHVRDKHYLISLYVIALAIPLTILVTFFLTQSSWLISGYTNRDFTLFERVLTQSRILLWYLRMIIVPDISQMSLFLDDISISKSLFQPITTLLSLITIIGLIVSALLLRKRACLYSFAILWFFAGHLMESTVIPLEMAYEHRNYLPSYGIILFICWSFFSIFNKFKIPSVKYVAASIFMLVLGISTNIRADQWRNPLVLALTDAAHHPNSPRANMFAAGVYATYSKLGENEEERLNIFKIADSHFTYALELNPNNTSSIISRILLYNTNGKNIPPSVLTELKQNLSTLVIDASTINALGELTKCQIDKVCTLSSKEYLSIMSNALDNPKLSYQFLANIYTNLADFQYAQTSDHLKVIKLRRLAVESAPDLLQYRLSLTRSYVNAGLLKEALIVIDETRQLDFFNALGHLLNQWENKIHKLSAEKNIKVP